VSDSIVSAQAEWLDLVHASVVICDTAGHILHWNAAAEQLYGRPRAEVTGQHIDAVTGTRYPETDPAADSWRSRITWRGEVHRIDSTGNALVVDIRREPQRNHAGTITGVVETGHDLTEARRKDAALRHSEYRYRNLFHAMAASFWELDFSAVGSMVRGLFKAGVTDLGAHLAAHPELVRSMMRATRVLDVNDQTVRLFGNGDRSCLLDHVEPFWSETSNQTYAQSVVAAVSGAPHYVAETRLRRIDGTEFDALFTACFAPDAVGRAKLLIGVIDISEQKRVFDELHRSESRYRNLFQAMAVSFWQLDSNGLNALFADLRTRGVTDLHAYIDENPGFLQQAMDASIAIDVNDRSVHLFGARDRSELLGPVTRFWIPGEGDAFRGSIEAAFNRQPGFQAETRLRTVDGREIDVLFFVTAPPHLRDQGMVLVGNIDISEQIRARATMRDLQNELAHASRVSILGELTASIAHEVNQPLAAIATNGEAGLRWLNRPEPDLEEVRTLVRRTTADARRASDIIARIRAMSQRRPHTPRPVSVNGIVREALRFLQHEIDAQATDIDLRLNPAVPPVHADRVQLQQVIINLIVNALQAMNAAGVQRPLITLRTDIDQSGVLLQVEDNGPGIATQDIPRLFESFFSTKPNGLGLGLPVCRSIIEAHGGDLIAANRESASGACFTVRLPTEVPADPVESRPYTKV
jgi:PAS domain S-box-containing protein